MNGTIKAEPRLERPDVAAEPFDGVIIALRYQADCPHQVENDDRQQHQYSDTCAFEHRLSLYDRIEHRRLYGQPNMYG